jgi:hypothetical protein
MVHTDDVPWETLATVAGGALALWLVGRGITAVARFALGEASYRASTPDTWATELHR